MARNRVWLFVHLFCPAIVPLGVRVCVLVLFGAVGDVWRCVRVLMLIVQIHVCFVIFSFLFSLGYFFVNIFIDRICKRNWLSCRERPRRRAAEGASLPLEVRAPPYCMHRRLARLGGTHTILFERWRPVLVQFDLS